MEERGGVKPDLERILSHKAIHVYGRDEELYGRFTRDLCKYMADTGIDRKVKVKYCDMGDFFETFKKCVGDGEGMRKGEMACVLLNQGHSLLTLEEYYGKEHVFHVNYDGGGEFVGKMFNPEPGLGYVLIDVFTDRLGDPKFVENFQKADFIFSNNCRYFDYRIFPKIDETMGFVRRAQAEDPENISPAVKAEMKLFHEYSKETQRIKDYLAGKKKNPKFELPNNVNFNSVLKNGLNTQVIIENSANEPLSDTNGAFALVIQKVEKRSDIISDEDLKLLINMYLGNVFLVFQNRSTEHIYDPSDIINQDYKFRLKYHKRPGSDDYSVPFIFSRYHEFIKPVVVDKMNKGYHSHKDLDKDIERFSKEEVRLLAEEQFVEQALKNMNRLEEEHKTKGENRDEVIREVNKILPRISSQLGIIEKHFESMASYFYNSAPMYDILRKLPARIKGLRDKMGYISTHNILTSKGALIFKDVGIIEILDDYLNPLKYARKMVRFARGTALDADAKQEKLSATEAAVGYYPVMRGIYVLKWQASYNETATSLVAETTIASSICKEEIERLAADIENLRQQYKVLQF